MIWFVTALLLSGRTESADEMLIPMTSLQVVIPVVIENYPWDVGQEAWVEVTYRAHAGASVLHEESGEKVWWVQDRALVVLGATGLPLPSDVTRRATVWISLWWEGEVIDRFEVYPRRDGVRLNENIPILECLGKRLPGLDAGYLAQVAHFLAGNLTTLDVQGTSFSISGSGPIVNASGDWVGGRLDTLSPGGSVFVGKDAGLSDDGGDRHLTAVGYEALKLNTWGDQNVAVGFESMHDNTTGGGNSALGYRALLSNTTGNTNTALGFYAMSENTIGELNTAVGSSALASNIDGDFNTAVGSQVMKRNTTGNYNTAVGNASMFGNSTGNENTAVGDTSLFLTETGLRNTAVGKNALVENVTGNWNTSLGSYSGFLSGQSFSNCTAIGDAAMVTASNQVRIGDIGITSIGGQVGWTSFSDGRFKTDVEEDVPGIAFIESLRPLTFRVDQAALKAEVQNDKPVTSPARKHTGFIAQEVERAANELGFEFSGVDVPTNEQSLYGLRYSQFVVPLVKAVQEQQAQIRALQKQIEQLQMQGNVVGALQ